jgi:inner membrane protein
MAGRVAALCILASIVPDLDSVVGLGPEEYLRHHRAFTHSFVGVALIALPLAGMGKLLFKSASMASLYLLSLAVMLLHVYQDLSTTFGTQILWPFTDHRFAFPGAFIIDPFLTGGMILLLLASLWKRKRAFFGMVGVGLAVVYPLVNLGIGSWMEQRIEGALRERGEQFVSVQATTDLLTPLYWKVIKDDGERLAIGSVSVWMDFTDPAFEYFPKPPAQLVNDLERQASIFSTWFWFAEHPVIASAQHKLADDRIGLTLKDLRFESRSPAVSRIAPDRKSPFTLTAILDERGNLMAYEYGDNGLVTIEKFLD